MVWGERTLYAIVSYPLITQIARPAGKIITQNTMMIIPPAAATVNFQPWDWSADWNNNIFFLYESKTTNHSYLEFFIFFALLQVAFFSKWCKYQCEPKNVYNIKGKIDSNETPSNNLFVGCFADNIVNFCFWTSLTLLLKICSK